ncbi:MAG: kelch repeat-containing protein [Elusimicrobiales bacterium]|nr:kelch repeat-containing protein [Elusimicrobiales bacterium]
MKDSIEKSEICFKTGALMAVLCLLPQQMAGTTENQASVLRMQLSIPAAAGNIQLSEKSAVPLPLAGAWSLTEYIREKFNILEVVGAFRLSDSAQLEKAGEAIKLKVSSLGSIKPHAALKPEEEKALMSMAARDNSRKAGLPVFTLATNLSAGYSINYNNTVLTVRHMLKNGMAAEAIVESGAVVYPGAYKDTSIIYLMSPGRCQEMLLLKSAKAPVQFEYEYSKEVSLSEKGEIVVDGLTLSRPVVFDAVGKRVSGFYRKTAKKNILLSFNGAGLQYPILIDPTWQASGSSMSAARYLHTASLLPNGKVLLAGGRNSSGPMSSAELYDPIAGTFATTGSLITGRTSHTATLLPNGKVLIVGGVANDTVTTLSSAEIYDPASGTFSATGSMSIARNNHVAVLLPSGKVLVAGGGFGTGTATLSSAELYDPATGTFSATGSMSALRQQYSAVLLPNGKVLLVGGTPDGTAGLVSADLYDYATGTFSATGSMSAARWRHTAILLPNGKVLVAGGAHNGSTISSAELYDPATGTFSATGSMGGLRQCPLAILLPNGKVLLTAGSDGSAALSSAELYDPASGTFSATGSMSELRSSAAAVLLPNGEVLVAGGYNGSATVSSADLYVLSGGAGTFSSTGSMSEARGRHKETLLPSGKVLLVGGAHDSVTFSLAELYDPSAGTFLATGSMSVLRQNPIAILLPNGKVLVAGGNNGSASFSSAELYDPAAGTFSATGSMSSLRVSHTATLLPNGKVLVAGGHNDVSASSSVELYDPISGTFSATGSMSVGRYLHTATLLPNGKVLIIGGTDGAGYLSSSELYDPSAGTFAATGALITGRRFHTATLMPNGKVLVVGGDNGAQLASAELYDPATGIFSATGSMGTARTEHAAIPLPNGKVLVAGGWGGGSAYFSSAELYNPSAGTFSAAGSMSVARDQYSVTLLPNGKVLLAGGASSGGATVGSADLYDTVFGSVNLPPTLAWTGEAGYISDGLSSNDAVSTTTFVYRVKYADADNDAPLSGYPKLHIKKGGIEISGSPFAMSFVSGTNSSGAIYAYSKTLSAGTDYTYYFEAQDANSAVATGEPVSAIDAPNVFPLNNSPTIDWTGEADYIADGLSLEVGVSTTTFVYRVKYTDADNDAPLSGYPKVHIKKAGSEISGSPFAMTFVSGAYNAGAIYTYTKTLPAIGTDYTYYFEAQDANSAAATPTSSVDAPDVTSGNSSPALAWTGENDYVSDGLNLETGDPSTSFVYHVKYTDADNDAPLSGYPKVHIKKGGVEISGSPFAMTFVSGANNTGAVYVYTKALSAIGTDYTYYFEAQDANTAAATGVATTPIAAPAVSALAQEGNKTTLGDNLFNPRAGGTSKIKLSVPSSGRVSLKIYNLAGKPIRTLFEGELAAGDAHKDWDGKDDSGRYVVPSVYFLHYVYPGGKEVRKIGVKR